VLKAQSRGSDLPARLGGDEFAVVLPHTDGAQAMIVASRILAAFEARVVEIRNRLAERASAVRVVTRRSGRENPARTADLPNLGIGLAERCRGGSVQPTALLEAADAALYRAKAQGAGRIEPSKPDVRVITRPSTLAA
ncbi:MAG: diguanylate cyclase, partial [Phycisphaerales bacterium]|nr:diguanylate cyclase [Phycisphaerales bacterium]